MEVEDFGTIKIELYPELAPQTISNFVTLANRGFYDNLTFHRIVKDFMIQGGDKEGTGQGSATLKDLKDDGEDSQYSIKGEFVANGVNNTLKFEEGVIGMARSDYTSYSSTLATESYNSAGSQFFIMTNNDHTNLSGYYAGFGKVIEGMDVVKAIENVECKSSSDDTQEETESEKSSNTEVSTPVEDVIISLITVDTDGVDYGMPKTLQPFNYMKWLYSLYGLTYSE